MPNEYEDSYQDVLPSLNLRLKLNRELQLRFAASKAIARPSLDQITANVTLGGDISRPTSRIRIQTLRRCRPPKW